MSLGTVPVRMSEEMPAVHRAKVIRQGCHQRNLSLDFRHVPGMGGLLAGGCRPGHQRNHSLDSVLQRIPEDMTPTSPESAAPAQPSVPRLTLHPDVPTGSDDSGILCTHAAVDADERDPDEEAARAASSRSRESLDSGNPEEAESASAQPTQETEPSTSNESAEPEKNKDSLLRLFECELFDMSMAISYLFSSKEPGVQSYLANKLFSFPEAQVDLYLPQLATIFIEMSDVAEMMRPYFIHRCKQSAEFSMQLAWLLEALGGDTKDSPAAKFLQSILAEEIRLPAARKGHHRSQSDASALRVQTPTSRHLGDLTSGRAFDNGCTCGDHCSCGAPRLTPQIEFVNALVGIGKRLAGVADKERRNGRLRAELATLNLNLPARIWLPLHSKPHHVLRIPPHAAAVLNSKDKAPYIMYVEVLETQGPHTPLPPRLLPPAPPAPHSPPIRHTKSEENLVPEWPMLSLYTGFEDLDDSECWSLDDDEITSQYRVRRTAPDALSQVSALSALSVSSTGSRESVAVTTSVVRRRLADATKAPPANTFRHDPTDPSALALKESWESKLARIRTASPYGSLPGWRLLGCIVKVGDDLRQELLASQLLKRLSLAWSEERIALRLQPYEILCLDKESGLIQPVLNSVSLHQIKRQSGKSLRAWLELEHGPPNSEGFMRAQTNFVESAAAYAITSYLLQLKDRHNGNILLDSAGHLIHIDFGFILSISPKNLGFEASPFKMTSEFVEVMDGEESDMFKYFKLLMLKGLIAAGKHMEQIINVVEVMRLGGQLACIRSISAVSALRARFHFGQTDEQLMGLVDKLVQDSMCSKTTRLYDKYQYYNNGIL